MDDFIREKGGFTAPITRGGGNISVGQAQSLCLARALLRGSKLLLLDEATSSLHQSLAGFVHSALSRAQDVTVIHVRVCCCGWDDKNM